MNLREKDRIRIIALAKNLLNRLLKFGRTAAG